MAGLFAFAGHPHSAVVSASVRRQFGGILTWTGAGGSGWRGFREIGQQWAFERIGFRKAFCWIRDDLLSFAGLLIKLGGAGRFERPTPCAQGRCATRLRYAPTFNGLFILKHFLTRRTPPRGQKTPKTGSTVPKPCQNPISWASPCQNSGRSRWPAGSASAEPPVSSAASSASTS